MYLWPECNELPLELNPLKNRSWISEWEIGEGMGTGRAQTHNSYVRGIYRFFLPPHPHSDSISPTPFSACSQLLVVVGPVHPSIPLNAQYFFDFATDACHTENSRFPSSLTLVFWHSAPCSSPVLHPEIPNPRRKLWASSSSSNAALNSFTLLYISHSVFNARETFFGKYRTRRRIYLWKRFIKMCLFYL